MQSTGGSNGSAVQIRKTDNGFHALRSWTASEEDTEVRLQMGLCESTKKMTQKSFRAITSKKNQYHISKHQFYVAYHFALQYPEWKEEYYCLINKGAGAIRTDSDTVKTNAISKPVERDAIRAAEISAKIKLIEDCVRDSDPTLYPWLLEGVTQEGRSYNYLAMRKNIPCGRKYYYSRRRKFYYLLTDKLEYQYFKD